MPRPPSHKLLISLLLVTGLVAVLLPTSRRYYSAGRLLQDLASEDRSLPPVPGRLFEDIRLPDGQPLRARIYGPKAPDARLTIVLVHGIHHQGIDEPRLIRFARHLAARGCRVLTPELRDLAEYQVTLRGVDAVRASVEHMASGGAVGLIGFSFGGGLSLVAATHPKTAHQLRYVASVGGHHDLHRTLRFLATHTVEGPRGRAPRHAHEYGLLVLLFGHLERFGLGADLPTFRAALKSWLMEDRARARLLAQNLTSKKATGLFQLVETQQMSALSAQMLTLLEAERPALLALSPAGRLQTIATEVLLLHGAGDNVVPPEETQFAELDLMHVRHRNYRTLVTPLLEHVRVDHPGDLSEKFALLRFVSRFF